MLKEYQITNFKPFAGPVNIPIKPITLIFGANSSGKSAIFQSSLMLKQTLEKGMDRNISLMPKGNLVDLGSFREFIHNHDVRNSFSFKMTFASPKDIGEAYDMNYGYVLGGDIDILGKSIISETIGLSVTFSWDSRASNIIIPDIKLYIGNDPEPVITYKIGEKDKRGIYEYEFTANFDHEYWTTYWKHFDDGDTETHEKPRNDMQEDTDYDITEEFKKMSDKEKNTFINKLEERSRKLDKLQGNDQAIKTYKSFWADIVRIERFLPGTLNHYTLGEVIEYDNNPESRDVSVFALTAANLIRKFLNDIEYIAPLREYPERFYVYGGNPLESVGSSGKMVFDVLFNNPELLDKVNEEFNRFGTDYELKLSPFSKDGAEIKEVFVPELINKSTGVAASFRDVGFGFSQILPVIVQSMSSKEKTLLIEQPELHLHPALQAELGDLFIKSALGENKNTFLIESHSEHLILRIMRRMRDTANGTLPDGLFPVSPKDVSILYAQPTASGTVIKVLELDSEGEFLDPWPEGFFEEGFRERFS